MKSIQDTADIHRPVVWVTGASRGIGKEIAKHFAFIGCEVCVSGRKMNALNAVVKEITKFGGRAYAFQADVQNQRSVHGTYLKIQKKFGGVDVLVNNAGISSFKPFLDTTMKEFEAIIATNLLGGISCIKEVVPEMAERKSGWIFNIISMVARKTYESSSAYTASKDGLLGLGKVLREELRRYNIKVVNVLPGATETEIWHPKIREKYADRMMKPESVAASIVAIFQMPPDLVVDEMVVRPIQGDLS
jgi:3-oxoacyl-[acyl-carrier protein] reductase